ncbi:MAG: DedA family protein [Candidatus Bathyarchaeota archaeon]|nr:DedA family protein [Candidatus Termiticorpusculum sp.]
MLHNNSRVAWLKRKAPQLLIVAVIIIVFCYFLLEILSDVLVEGSPWTSGPVIGAIIAFTHNVTDTISSWGYIGVFLLMLLESSSFPIPSEVILPFAGYLVSVTELALGLTIFYATIAGVLGSLIDYYIGRKGVSILSKHKLLGRVIFSPAQLTTAANWFNRYGVAAVFFGRLVPGFRTFISFPAGAVKMSIPKFIVFTAAGCLIWNSILVYVGYYLGSNWAEVAGISHYLILGIILVVAGGVIYWLIRRRKRKQNKQERT